ncbi:MAG: hypothetical protein G01um101431_59 [Parcubacteria group bacterium Gr01-1014_31]|nr:MAG: hypothetical protein G01um101431_59 [Parcubacteria group bacterium Gr01-1014_31]
MLHKESSPKANEEEPPCSCEHPTGKVRLQHWGPREVTLRGVRVFARCVRWVCLACGQRAEKIVGFSHIL